MTYKNNKKVEFYMFNKEFTDLINELFGLYEKRYTRLYEEVLKDFDMIEEQTTNDFKDSIMYHMLLNSDIDGETIEEIYYHCYECFCQDEGFTLEIELDYLIDNMSYYNVRDSMIYDQVN